jgi:xylulose-5-phosphate/fructose-6-phosphate phosphoketolase
VNVSELTALGLGDENQDMTDNRFVHYYTKDKPIIFNFHGYPSIIKQMFFGRSSGKRVIVNGYIENGSTTTPYDLQIRNGTSRYQLVTQAAQMLKEWGAITIKDAKELEELMALRLKEHKVYVKKNGVDPEHITNWKFGECPGEFEMCRV